MWDPRQLIDRSDGSGVSCSSVTPLTLVYWSVPDIVPNDLAPWLVWAGYSIASSGRVMVSVSPSTRTRLVSTNSSSKRLAAYFITPSHPCSLAATIFTASSLRYRTGVRAEPLASRIRYRSSPGVGSRVSARSVFAANPDVCRSPHFHAMLHRSEIEPPHPSFGAISGDGPRPRVCGGYLFG